MSFRNILISLSVAATFVVTGCASSQMKQRKEQRDRIVQSAKLYCDFVNGEIYPDVEVQLNLEMAKRCDSSKNFSVTNYKTSNENVGVLYCCGMSASATVADKPAVEKETPAAAPARAADKKDDKKADAPGN